VKTIGHAVKAAIRLADQHCGQLRVSPALQSWPGIVHGGAVVAVLDAVAIRLGVTGRARIVEGRLTSSLPPDTDLELEAEPWEDGLTLNVFRNREVLSSGTIRPGRDAAVGDAIWAGGADGTLLPTSDDCLACGARNPLGLQLAPRFDDEGVWAVSMPGREWRRPDGSLDDATLPVLLDEIAWWLGALVAKEGGVTNRIALTLSAPVPAGVPLVVSGRFGDVTPIDKRRMFWRTSCAVRLVDGTPCATASIVFRGGPEYSQHQLPYFRARTPSTVFRRMFPGYAGPC
jgi:hypothetical protein